MQHQPLWGNFHNHTITASFHHFVKILLNYIGFWCGIRSRYYLISDNCLNSTDQTNLVSGIFQNGFYHIGSSGFSLGSGNSDCFQLLCRMSKPGRWNKCHSISGVRHLDNRNIWRCRNLLFYYQNFSPFCCYIRDKFMSIYNSTSDTDKQRAVCYLSGIINNTSDFLLCAPLHAGVF